MMSGRQSLSINPFADDIVDDPRCVEYSVPGLNEKVAAEIVSRIDVLCSLGEPSGSAHLGKALIVFSPRAGFGKSHLIGTVFRRLSGRATLVNVRPFEDPTTRWKSILDRIVQELDFADRYLKSDADRTTQLELFAHGVLSRIAADHLEANRGSKRDIERLRQPPEQLIGLKAHKKWREFIDKATRNGAWLTEVQRRLDGYRLRLDTPLQTWLRVLYSYAYQGDDWDLRRSCLDWIQGDAIEDEVAAAIGIRVANRVNPMQSASELNALAKTRVLDLCRLSKFFRPFLFCFDQTETYGKSPELAAALGGVIHELVDEGTNHVTVITANMDPWEKLLRPHWQDASRDRLHQPYLTLEGISLQQGCELAEHRLGLFDVDRAGRDRFWGDRRWLEEHFASRNDVSVREFLHRCTHRWAESVASSDVAVTPAERVPLATLFEKYVDAVSAKPRRLVFDRDTLHWVVRELADGLDGVEVGTHDDRTGGALPLWRHGGKEYVFGFESGTHWKRWQNIARDALGGGTGRGRVLVYPRTYELPPIPKPTWNVVKPDIERARASGSLLILELTKHRVVELHAAHDMYADALQGDIDWNANDVLPFLRERLADFWREVLDSRGAPEPTRDPDSVSPSPSSAAQAQRKRTKQRRANGGEGELSRRIVDVIRSKRFISLDEVVATVPGVDREAVLGICGGMAGIKVHAHPNQTILQWQSA